MNYLIAVLIASLFTSAAFAAEGNHFGEQECLNYSISYLNPALFVNYPQYGHYNVPGYYIGMPMNYLITISNKCERSLYNLRAVGVQTEFNGTMLPDQAWSEGAPHWNGDSQTFFIPRLKGGQSVSFYAKYFSLNGRPGLDKTRLLVLHWAAKNPETSGGASAGRIIIDDENAGIWCPP